MKKIEVETHIGKKVMTVAQYIELQLDSDRDGALERAHDNAEKAQSAIARLCDILVGKGILDANEITVIAGGYTRDAQFIDE